MSRTITTHGEISDNGERSAFRKYFEAVARILTGSGEAAVNGCLACGYCCQLFGGNLRASQNDLKRWKESGREDILKLVNRLGWIWVDPKSGKFVDPCPFLKSTPDKKCKCGIHDTKPDMCRAYPTLAHEKRCVRGVNFG